MLVSDRIIIWARWDALAKRRPREPVYLRLGNLGQVRSVWWWVAYKKIQYICWGGNLVQIAVGKRSLIGSRAGGMLLLCPPFRSRQMRKNIYIKYLMPFLFLTSSHSSVISKASSTQKMNIAAASGGENIHLNIYAQAKKSLCRLYFFLQRARLLNLTFIWMAHSAAHWALISGINRFFTIVSKERNEDGAR